ncbi:MAG: hypothetical protein ACOCXA_05035 [Planctomycetota bacterium]
MPLTSFTGRHQRPTLRRRAGELMHNPGTKYGAVGGLLVIAAVAGYLFMRSRD